MIRLYRFPFSTNVERVALALAYKGLEADSVWIDPNDRTPVREVSGQDLVPVIEHDGSAVADSMQIIHWLERNYPDPPLYPREAARHAEMLIFIEWFDRVWKRPPNEIEAELRRPEPDRQRIHVLSCEMAGWLDLFDQLLDGRDYLLGEFSAADCAAFPFLKYGHIRDPSDTELFHQILMENLALGDRRHNLRGWIERMDKRPRV